MEEIKLIVENDPKSPIAETYRSIRTNLQFAGAGRELKYICFTSSVPGEGKSTTISNLALTLAQDGKKVLLVDCDLRKPVLSGIFGVINQGVTNCLAQDVPFAQVLHPEVFHNLDLLTSGPVPPNPSAHRIGKRWTSYPTVEKRYDYVLIDLPPVLAVTDAALLGNLADGVVLVVHSGQVAPESPETRNAFGPAKPTSWGRPQRRSPAFGSYGYGYGYYYYDYYDENHVKHTKKKAKSKE